MVWAEEVESLKPMGRPFGGFVDHTKRISSSGPGTGKSYIATALGHLPFNASAAVPCCYTC